MSSVLGGERGARQQQRRQPTSSASAPAAFSRRAATNFAFIATLRRLIAYRRVSTSAQTAERGFDCKMVNEVQMQRVRGSGDLSIPCKSFGFHG